MPDDRDFSVIDLGAAAGEADVIEIGGRPRRPWLTGAVVAIVLAAAGFGLWYRSADPAPVRAARSPVATSPVTEPAVTGPTGPVRPPILSAGGGYSYEITAHRFGLLFGLVPPPAAWTDVRLSAGPLDNVTGLHVYLVPLDTVTNTLKPPVALDRIGPNVATAAVLVIGHLDCADRSRSHEDLTIRITYRSAAPPGPGSSLIDDIPRPDDKSLARALRAECRATPK